MVVRHHVRDHSRSGYHVHDYERGHGKVTAFRGQYHGPLYGKLTYAERQRLSSKEFAIPSQRKYPIDTANRARNALARVSAYGTPEEKRRVCEAVHRKYPGIHEAHCPVHDKTAKGYKVSYDDKGKHHVEYAKTHEQAVQMQKDLKEQGATNVKDPPGFFSRLKEKVAASRANAKVREDQADLAKSREEYLASEERKEAQLKKDEQRAYEATHRPSLSSRAISAAHKGYAFYAKSQRPTRKSRRGGKTARKAPKRSHRKHKTTTIIVRS